MISNKISDMDAKDFLFQKYLDWQRESGERQTQAKFAAYLGVSPASLSDWMSGSHAPSGAQNLTKLASKLGPEIYDVLSMSRPGQNDPELQQIIDRWPRLSEAKRASILATANEAEPAAETKRLSPGLNSLK